MFSFLTQNTKKNKNMTEDESVIKTVADWFSVNSFQLSSVELHPKTVYILEISEGFHLPICCSLVKPKYIDFCFFKQLVTVCLSQPDYSRCYVHIKGLDNIFFLASVKHLKCFLLV